MKKLILLFGLAIPLTAQVSNPSIVLVTSAPSGSCANGLPNRQVLSTGVQYSCQGGTWGTISGSSYAGVTSDGANGLAVTGQVAANNYVGPLQPTQNYVPRSLKSKLDAMTAHLSGVTGYTTPAQAYLVTGGDSTTGFHAGGWVCSLVQAYGAVGYVASGIGGLTTEGGYLCPPTGGASMTLGGSATTESSWQLYPTGSGFSIPSGSYVTAVNPFYSTRQLAFYTATASGATATVSTSPDGTTWTPLSGCNGVTVTANVGGVCDQTITAGNYYLRITAGGSGTLHLWTVGQVDTAIDGIVVIGLGVGGTSLPDQASTPQALTNPWYVSIHPDAFTFEMKDNGIGNGYPSCGQATTANPTVFQSRSYWWNLWTEPYLNANPLVDSIYFGSYPINDQCIPVYNTAAQQWSQAQTPQQIYIDNYFQTTNAQMVTLGLIPAGNVHATATGAMQQTDFDMHQLGSPVDWGSTWVPKNIVNNHTATNNIWFGGTSVALGPSTPSVGTKATFPVSPLPQQPIAHLYVPSGGNIAWDLTGQLDFWEGTHTTPLFCMAPSTSAGAFPTGCFIQFTQGLGQFGGSNVPLTATNSGAGTEFQVVNTGTGNATVALHGGTSGAIVVNRYFAGATEYWRSGLNSNTNYTIVDQANSHAVVNLVANTMPANSISGNSSGPILLVMQVPSARKGTFTCTGGGTITIANTNEAATSDVIISLNAQAGTITTPPAMKTVTAGTGFTVLCGTTDTSTYNYDILN